MHCGIRQYFVVRGKMAKIWQYVHEDMWRHSGMYVAMSADIWQYLASGDM